MKKTTLKRAVKKAQLIVPPNGAITYDIVDTKDKSFYARINLSNTNPCHIEYNRKVFDSYFKENKIEDEYHKELYYIQVTIHEILHSKIFNTIKNKEHQELVCELGEQIYRNILMNLPKL